MNDQAVITFPNTYSAMVAKRALGGVLVFEVMPTPRSITKSCGIAIRLAVKDIEKALAQFALAGLASDCFVVHQS